MDWDADIYAANAGFVPALGEAAFEALDPRPGEAILDLGCGDGVLTGRIAAAGADVLGLDSSPSMLAAARARGLRVQEGDGQQLAFDNRFDAVFSNAALHWMADQDAVALGVFRALRPGGRYVGECGGFGNIAAIRVAIRAALHAQDYPPEGADAQVYQTVEAFTARHEAAGFTRIEALLVPRPTPLPTGIAGWLATFRGGFLDAAGVPEDARAAIAAHVEMLLGPILTDGQGRFIADYVRLRWRAFKPGN